MTGWIQEVMQTKNCAAVQLTVHSQNLTTSSKSNHQAEEQITRMVLYLMPSMKTWVDQSLLMHSTRLNHRRQW
jgi:hypothetical protein